MKNLTQKLYAFDWNGTLFDDSRVIHQCFVTVQKAYGYEPCSFEDYQRWFEFPIDRLYRNAGFSDELIATKIEEMQKCWHAAYAVFEKRTALRAGAEQMLREITSENVHCVIFSNHFKGPIETQCARLHISPFFQEVLASKDLDEQLQAPPKKERLLRYMERNKISPSRAILIGDTEEEVSVAREFGATSIAITGGWATAERLAACHPDHTIDSLSEIPAIGREVFAAMDLS